MRTVKDVVSILVLLLLVFLGETPALAGVKLLIIPQVQAHYPTLDRTAMFLMTVAWAFMAIAVVGWLLGLISYFANREKQAKKGWFGRLLERKGWDRERRVGPLLKKGEPFGFVLGSLIGGAALVAWWYARKADRYAMTKATIAAFILAVASSLLWVGQFTPGYEWTGWAAIITMLVLAVPFTYLVRRLRGAPRTA